MVAAIHDIVLQIAERKKKAIPGNEEARSKCLGRLRQQINLQLTQYINVVRGKIFRKDLDSKKYARESFYS